MGLKYEVFQDRISVETTPWFLSGPYFVFLPVLFSQELLHSAARHWMARWGGLGADWPGHQFRSEPPAGLVGIVPGQT